jgi:hypothetical protein
MLILNDKPGQLCNRLWAYSFFIAYAQKHALKIYIPHFREYQKYFENLSSLPDVYFQIASKPKIVDTITFHTYRMVGKVLRLLNQIIDLKIFNIFIDHQHWNQEHWQWPVVERKNRIVFLGSWFHQKDTSALLEYKGQILTLFQPAKQYKERVDLVFTDIRKRYDIIIGIHIRRTDYLDFHKGVYYFDDNAYSRYIHVLKRLFSSKHVCFFLASDQPIVESTFRDYETVYFQHPAMMEDLYALSQCNYIVGPPSTFSMWASFISDIPLRILRYQDEKITLEQFSPILFQNVFRNGEQFHHIDNRDETLLHEKSLGEYSGRNV